MRSHSLLILLVLLTALLHRASAACQPVVPYEENDDYSSSASLNLQPLKHEECDCGYVLVEKIVHVCRPQKSLVKVLRKKGNCLLHDKPLEIDQKYTDYRAKPEALQSPSPCDDTSSQEDFE